MSEKYRNISLKTEFANAIEQFILTNPQYGYRSIAQFIEDAARKRLEALKGLGPEVLPRLERVNYDENGVKILDRHLHEVIQVYFKPKGILCEHCEAPLSCDFDNENAQVSASPLLCLL